MEPIRLFNSLSHKLEPLKPLKAGQVRIYSCGPTVYDFAHIGNFRAWVVADILVRWLKFSGYRVKWVMNITDIDDKTIAGAQKAGLSLKEFTSRYEQSFFQDLKTINIGRADVYPKATEHTRQMLKLIDRLKDKGLAYQAADGIYFDISKFKNYGRWAGLDLKGRRPGARVAVDIYDKDDLRDFALWKFETAKQKETQPPISPNSSKRGDAPHPGTQHGRPGWHIECSAMSVEYLGQPFDIHTGGIDLLFPHHTNEIAQSEGSAGKPLAKVFVHNEHLLVEGAKMAKSAGNFLTLHDIVKKGFDPIALRYLYLQSRYREKQNFTFEALESAGRTLRSIRELIGRQVGRRASKAGPKDEVLKALANDLDTPRALALLHQKREARAWLELDSVLGLRLSQQASRRVSLTDDQKQLVNDRERARHTGDFKRSDEIRDRLGQQGIRLEDTSQGPIIRTG